MISYYDGQITDILPWNITKDPAIKAISYALQQACSSPYWYGQKLSIYFSVDEQPEKVIDLLAKELRTQYYQADMDLKTKKKLVKNTLIWHMGAGTPAAVEELVTTVFGEGKVMEWFEYGDDPYYFKIETNATLTPEINTLFTDMVCKVKNTRSHLRAIDIHRTITNNFFAGIGVSAWYRAPAIADQYDISAKEKKAGGDVHAAAI